jgi:aspartate carbamoyltransferase catalytic subunit
LKIEEDTKEYLKENSIPYSESFDNAEELKEIVSRADILYITQIPKDRFKNHDEDYSRSREIFRINRKILKIMKKDTYIMHPLPRDYELPIEIDQDPRAVYFDLIKYGQFLRMGLLCLALGVPVD